MSSPPCPPAPMDTAGKPSDSGTFASVDAQSIRERMFRYASTDWTIRNSRELSGSLPPGREPDSLILAERRAPREA